MGGYPPKTAVMLPAILPWYDSNGRDLPWRRDSKVYPVWVSEVMLQQTRVATVLPYFTRWIERFPDLAALAGADESDVLAQWQGLGYYRRARLFHQGARYVLERGMPTSFEEWRRVPGVGNYTAAALASITLGIPKAVVDGNVRRVYSRLAADLSTGSRLERAAQAWGDRSIDPTRPGDWNQAVMEIGATICTPKNPRCQDCPLAAACLARAEGQVERYPARRAAVDWREMECTIIVATDGVQIGIEPVPPGPWWQGMWQFETIPGNVPQEFEFAGAFRHTVSRHRLRFEVWLNRRLGKSHKTIAIEDLGGYALPAPYRKAFAMAAGLLTGPEPRSSSARP